MAAVLEREVEAAESALPWPARGHILYLSAPIASPPSHPALGIMLTPAHGNRPDLSHTQWAADNGCFTRGAAFRVGDWIEWLWAMAAGRPTCLFATAPDVVADARATLARSLPVLPQLRIMGYRPALVAQDGLEDLDVPWGEFDALFVGGSTRWKLSETAAGLVAEARARGKWCHFGRVNSLPRLRYAADIGCHSADGTHLRYRPRRYAAAVLRWFDDLERRPSLWWDAPADP